MAFLKLSKIKLSTLDIVCLGFILVILIGLLVNVQKINLVGDDVWYHMSVAQKILESKKIPLEDSWSFQPLGRPHLYPPLFHLAIAGISGSPENVVNCIPILACLLYPLALLASWYAMRRLFNSKIAFLILLFLAVDVIFSIPAFELTPSALVLIFLPLLLVTFINKKVALSVLLLTLILYTHTILSICAILILLIYSLKFQDYKKYFRNVCLWSLLFFSPWLIHILWHINYISLFNYAYRLQHFGLWSVALFSGHTINILYLFLAVLALFILRRKLLTEPYYILPCTLIGLIPMLILLGGRYWWHVEIFIIALAALPVQKYLPKKIPVLAGVIALVLTFYISLPLLKINVGKPGINLSRSMSGLVKVATIAKSQKEIDEDLIKVADFIKENTKEDEIIVVHPNTLSPRITVLTGRKTNSGMHTEILNKEAFELSQNLEKSPANIFVVLDKQKIPKDCQAVQFGDYWVGMRES